MKKEIKIPDIAENVETGTIGNVLVSEGDKVSADQAVVEVETDKATTDIPSPYDGVVAEIKVAAGDEVKVNQVIMVIETEGDGEDEEEDKGEKDDEKKDKKKASAKAASSKEVEGEEEEEEESSDKGEEESEEEDKDEGSDEDEDKKGKGKGTDKDEEEGTDEEAEDKEKEDSKDEEDEGESKKASASDDKKDMADIPASPSVRRLAREMDVDLRQVQGSGPGKRITAEDVKSHAEKPAEKKKEKSQLPNFSKWGMVSPKPMDNIRKVTARNVQEAWQTIPHVTQFDEADMTELEAFRKKSQEQLGKEGAKITVTALLLKVVGFALQKFPQFNTSLDAENEQIIFKHYYHIGIAVDTPHGLLVPVVRDVNTKSLLELSAELTELAEKARNKKLSADDMQGGSFTISNLGGIGGTNFTPIVYAPQVAILGVSRSKYQQVLVGEEFQKRLVIPLSLSYDHRVIDGADGARFLRWICQVIEDPFAILQ
jgi:pyruvate dehydrogenase E2 component (dihydrolipoamide acetyltransferase)